MCEMVVVVEKSVAFSLSGSLGWRGSWRLLDDEAEKIIQYQIKEGLAN